MIFHDRDMKDNLRYMLRADRMGAAAWRTGDRHHKDIDCRAIPATQSGSGGVRMVGCPQSGAVAGNKIKPREPNEANKSCR